MDQQPRTASRLGLSGPLPLHLDVYEVGPRDGLQNEKEILSTADKVRLIRALMASGLRRIEVTSFVSPKWIPQLADAGDVLKALGRHPGVVFSALVPNLKGLQRAHDAGLEEAAVFLSASESHSKKNINKSIREAVESAREVAAEATRLNMRVRGYLSTVWGCPYEKDVPLERVVELVRELRQVGLYELSLGDTIGVGTPLQTERILSTVLKHVPPAWLGLHLHDTRGTALANALVGVGMGIATLDASIGGLGGCPYATGAAGNLATEDLVYMLQGMGIETGVNLPKLVEAGELAQTLIRRKLTGKYLQAALGERLKGQSQPPAQT